MKKKKSTYRFYGEIGGLLLIFSSKHLDLAKNSLQLGLQELLFPPRAPLSKWAIEKSKKKL